jgi:hypothetical protein
MESTDCNITMIWWWDYTTYTTWLFIYCDLLNGWRNFLKNQNKKIQHADIIWHDTNMIWAASWQNQRNAIATSICAVWSGSMLFAIIFSTCKRVGKRTAWILIRLRWCAGWSGSMLVVNALCWFCRDVAQLMFVFIPTLLRSYGNFPTLLVKDDFIHYFRYEQTLEKNHRPSII